MMKCFGILVMGALVWGFFNSVCMAADVALEWEQPAYADVVGGYRVNYGEYPNASGNEKDVDKTLQYTVSGLDAGKVYCFQVRARGLNGGLSDPSNKVCWGAGLEMSHLGVTLKLEPGR